MRLPLFRSKAGQGLPNLVGLQDPALQEILPTMLVCPLREGAALTGLREVIVWDGNELVALCDLARPIRQSALRQMGELDEAKSREILRTFSRLLAR